MKRAVAQVSVKVNRVTYIQGATFVPPYPSGWDEEIKRKSGLILEFDSDQSPAKSVVEVPAKTPVPKEAEQKDPGTAQAGETEADEKKRLEAYALSKFNVKIDRRKSLEAIRKVIAKLEATDSKPQDQPAAEKGQEETQNETANETPDEPAAVDDQSEDQAAADDLDTDDSEYDNL